MGDFKKYYIFIMERGFFGGGEGEVNKVETDQRHRHHRHHHHRASSSSASALSHQPSLFLSRSCSSWSRRDSDAKSAAPSPGGVASSSWRGGVMGGGPATASCRRLSAGSRDGSSNSCCCCGGSINRVPKLVPGLVSRASWGEEGAPRPGSHEGDVEDAKGGASGGRGGGGGAWREEVRSQPN